MCDLRADYTTVTGPRQDIERIAEGWPSHFETARRFGRLLDGPVVMHLGDLVPDPRCPAVAVFRHDPALGRVVADHLQGELGVYWKLHQLRCEPGFAVQATSNGGANTSVSTSKLLQYRGATKATPGRRVAVLDSGDLPRAGVTMTDFVGLSPAKPSPREVPAADDYGHGTAVSEVIRTLRPGAVLSPVRVLNDQGRADSYELFLALTFCLWGGRFDLVNASLTNAGKGACANSLGSTLTLIQQMCRLAGSASTTLVAAAGNAPQTSHVGYPALLPDAVIATATDWQGLDPGYNVSTAHLPNAVRRDVGGKPGDGLGDFWDSTGAKHEMYGTSFAAAVVTASLI